MSRKIKPTDDADFEDIPDDFFDDFEDDDFLDEICDVMTEPQTGNNESLELELDTDQLESSDDDHRLMNEIDKLSKSIQCRKRKLREAENLLANDFEKYKKCHSHRRRKSKSPSLNILKKAVERCRRNETSDYSSSEYSFERSRSTNELAYYLKDGSEENDYRKYNKPITGGDIAESSIFETSSELRKIDLSTSSSIRDKPAQQSQARFIKSPSTYRQFNDQPQLQKIVNDIVKGFKVMILMRGPPGCGKSHLAQEIINETTKDCYSDHIFSSYEYFYDKHGKFQFKRIDISDAHYWNKSNVGSYAKHGWSPIIVDDTNTKTWQLSCYLKIAVEHGYLVEIVQPDTPWSESIDDLYNMNIHNVSKETIVRMITAFQPTTVDELMKYYDLQYTKPMPQYRNHPKLH